MSGFNLPPGCSVRDIPGNRPEDEAAEAFADMVYNEFEMKMSEDVLDHVIRWAQKLYSDAYQAGYQQARADDAEAKDILETEKLAREYFAEDGRVKAEQNNRD